MLQELFGQQTGDSIATFGREFGEAVSGVKPDMTGVIDPTRTGVAALGVATPFLQAMQPTYDTLKEAEEFNYEGPYLPTERTSKFRGANDGSDTSEFSYFDNTNPYPGYGPAPSPGYAEGGEVDRTVQRPTAGYRAGMGPEHNYNFRPLGPPPGMTSRNGNQTFADVVSRNTGGSAAARLRRFRYDPRTQTVVDDGLNTGVGWMGGAGEPGSGGGGSRLPTRMNGSRFASGGDVHLRNGSFVVDARTVSELGNGSSGAGQELLARLGGQAIRGAGDGVSDSIPANIDGRQRAKVARDEVKFDPEAVRRIGGGDQKRGAQKLYELMEKAQKARKAAGRGQDTKLRKKL
jgi:hypothetical protein